MLSSSQAQVTKLEGQIATLKDRPDTTQTAYDELQAQLKTVQENITTLTKIGRASCRERKNITEEKNARNETNLDTYNKLKTSLTEAEAQVKTLTNDLTATQTERDARYNLDE